MDCFKRALPPPAQDSGPYVLVASERVDGSTEDTIGLAYIEGGEWVWDYGCFPDYPEWFMEIPGFTTVLTPRRTDNVVRFQRPTP